jgi:hypothetical protein
MHGVAADACVMNAPFVRQPVNTQAMVMAENTATKERSLAFIVFGKVDLIKTQ